MVGDELLVHVRTVDCGSPTQKATDVIVVGVVVIPVAVVAGAAATAAIVVVAVVVCCRWLLLLLLVCWCWLTLQPPLSVVKTPCQIFTIDMTSYEFKYEISTLLIEIHKLFLYELIRILFFWKVHCVYLTRRKLLQPTNQPTWSGARVRVVRVVRVRACACIACVSIVFPTCAYAFAHSSTLLVFLFAFAVCSSLLCGADLFDPIVKKNSPTPHLFCRRCFRSRFVRDRAPRGIVVRT